MKQFIAIFLGVSLTVLALAAYNQWRWYGAKNAVILSPQINIDSLPTSVKPNQVFTVNWRIESGTQKEIKSTAIYYGSIASPSALLDTDTPNAVNYALVTPDYLNGNFLIPGDFSVRLQAPSQGKLFLRAYAFVDGRHLWTDEKRIDVQL